MDLVWPLRAYKVGFSTGLRVVYDTNYEIDGNRNGTPGLYVRIEKHDFMC